MTGGLARVAVMAALLTAVPASSRAQTNLQLWGNVTLDWMKSERLTYELDFEPKGLVSAPAGDPAWRSLDITPNVEYAVRPWLDLSGDLGVGYTKQTDDVNTVEVTPRVGARFHLYSRAVKTRGPNVREMAPRRRVVIRDLVRFESRNFFYTGAGSGSDSSFRFRNRLELLVPLNTEKLSDDGTRYVLADWEWFIPLGEPDERFANRQRIRAGLGYRRNLHWRFEGVYMWTRSRNTIEDGFTTSDNIINIRVKRLF